MANLRLAFLLMALALLAPSAVAASARGELASTAMHLTDVRMDAASVDVVWNAEGAPRLELHLAQADVHRYGQREVSTGVVGYEESPIDESASYADVTLTLEPGAGTNLVVLRQDGAALATLPAADVVGVGGILHARPLAEADANDDGCNGEDCLDAFGVHELSAPHGAANLTGETLLLLYGPTLRIGDDAYASGPTSSQDAGGAAGIVEDAWVIVRATGVTGAFQADAPFKIYSAAPTLRVASATFDDAEGAVRVGMSDYRAHGEDVATRGALLLTPEPVERAADHGVARRTPEGDVYVPEYADSVRTQVSGNVESINLGGAPAFLDSPAEKAGAAALLAAGLAAAAYYSQHLAFGAATLYTRLKKPDILDNEVRNHIYDIIRAHPGISAREVHRQSEQSWGTVVYHLRQLERHHLVVSRALGRTRNYYENHGKYRGMEVQLACLQSDRARALARAIVAQPGITQEALASVSGFPQPTTSYYVRKLKQAGLVEEQRDGRYAKYVPHADLPRFIQLSESTPDVGAAAASGVQA